MTTIRNTNSVSTEPESRVFQYIIDGPNLSLINNGATQSNGIVGNSATFESSNNDNLQGGTEKEYQPDTSFTCEMWVYSTNLSTERTVVSNYNGGDGVGWEVSVGSGGNMIFYLHDGSNYIFPKGGSISTNQWWHLVSRWDGSKAELFINNTSVASETISSVASSPYDWLVGSTQGPGGEWQGKIGPIRLWHNRSLSDNNIGNLFNSGNGASFTKIKESFPKLLNKLVAAYEFEDSNNLGKDTIQ